MKSITLVWILLSATPPKSVDIPERVEIVRPESYGIKRFGEIIQEYQSSQPTSLQELIIENRAKLVIAEQKLITLKERKKSPAVTPEGEVISVKDTQIRAYQARVDHYENLVSRLEAQILREKRKERSSSAKKQKQIKGPSTSSK